MDIIKIALVLGTDRPERRSLAIAELIAKFGGSLESVKITFVDPGQFEFSYAGGDTAYSEIVESSDAFIIVTPEYNHSFPGTLKTLLDTELAKYLHKPVAIAGVSSGPLGGARAVESLLPVLRELGMTATKTSLYFSLVKEFFDDSGEPLDKSVYERMDSFYKELVWMARTLKWGRENLN